MSKQLKKQVSVKETERIEIPKYILDGNQYIPEDLNKVLDYFRDCGNKNYQVCLLGEKESVAAKFYSIVDENSTLLVLDADADDKVLELGLKRLRSESQFAR